MPTIATLERVVAPPRGLPASVAVIKELLLEAAQTLDPVDGETLQILLGLNERDRPRNKTSRIDLAAQLRGKHHRRPSSPKRVREQVVPSLLERLAEVIIDLDLAYRRQRRESSGHEEVPERFGSRLELDWPEMDRLAAELANRLRPSQPDAVIGVARGGLVPAVRVSHILGIRPLGALRVWKHGNRADAHQAVMESMGIPPGQYATLAVVDDIVGTQQTMDTVGAAIQRAFADRPPRLVQASLVRRMSASDYDPTIWHSAEWACTVQPHCWVVFPWERPAPY